MRIPALSIPDPAFWNRCGAVDRILYIALLGVRSDHERADSDQIAQTTNPASLAVLRKNGFVPVKTYMQEWPADKGGGEREVNRLELIL